MYEYICVTHASSDRAKAELFCHTLARYGFRYQSMTERDTAAKRDELLGDASLLIALTSPAAAETETVAADIRHALSRGMTVLLVSFGKNLLDGRFSAGESGPAIRIPYPEGDAPDRHAVALFIHRLFVRHLSRLSACISVSRCATDVYGQTVLCAVRAHSGDREAMYTLGRAYGRGEGVPTLDVEAAYWMSLAAEQGVPDARIRMGELYLSGKGTDRDPVRAFRLFDAAAEAGDERGDYHRGLCYLHGFGVVRDPAYAAECLQKAADRGYAPALYGLALLYRDGVGVKVSVSAARDYLYAALSQTLPKITPVEDEEEMFVAHDAPRRRPLPTVSLYGRRDGRCYRCISMRQMRRTHLAGLLSVRHGADPRKTLSAFGRSRVTDICLPEDGWLDGLMTDGRFRPDLADVFCAGRYTDDWTAKNAAEVAVELARLLDRGCASEGIHPAPLRALAWYRYAIRLGQIHALYRLGDAYRRGRGLPASMTRAAGLFGLAASLGDVEAQFALGVCYERGLGVPVDMTRAVRCYELSAEAGYPPAQNNLGGCYERGEGVLQNQLTAVEWYARAAAEGLPAASCRLGICYELGLGVTRDTARAVRYYRAASNAGYPYAAYRLALCYDRGVTADPTVGSPDPTTAFRLYTVAAEGGVPEASYALFLCYRDGLGVAPDPREALHHLRVAAEAGQLQAAYEWGLACMEGEDSLRDRTAAVAWFARAARVWCATCERPCVTTARALHPHALSDKQAAGGALYMLGFCTMYGVGATGSTPNTPTPERVSEALPYLQAAAEAGHAGALTMLGDLHAHGLMPTPDVSQATRYYLEAARAGGAMHAHATVDYADSPVNALLSLAEIARRSAEDALREGDESALHTAQTNMWRTFSEAAVHGSADALIGMAECLFYGWGVPRDPTAAVELLARAELAEGGRTEAALWRGDYLQSGQNAAPDLAAAEDAYLCALRSPAAAPECGRYALHLRRARRSASARLARTEILYRLAILRALRGEGQDAFGYLSEAIRSGHTAARADLARMYAHAAEEGRIAAAAEDRSSRRRKGRKKSIREGQTPADWTVAYYTALRPEVTPFDTRVQSSVDPAELPAWMTDGVDDLTLAEALYFLGECHFFGRHLPTSEDAAVACYRAVLDLKIQVPRGTPAPACITQASYSLGWCLLYGEGAPADPATAVKLLTAASKTHAAACYTLGLCHEQGLGGTKPDAREAVKYYRKAYKLGDRSVARRLLSLEKRLQNAGDPA